MPRPRLMAKEAIPCLDLQPMEYVEAGREAHAMAVMCVAGESLRKLQWVTVQALLDLEFDFRHEPRQRQGFQQASFL